MRNNQKQLRLPFKESKQQRCERILSGKLGAKLRRASSLAFDYEAASRLARSTTGAKP